VQSSEVDNRRLERLDQRLQHIDRRVDDLSHRVDLGFARVDGELRQLRSEFGDYQRTVIRIGGGLIAALLLGICLIATQI
jgi:hypothetical protein